MKKLIEKDKPTESWGGISTGKHVNFYGTYYEESEDVDEAIEDMDAAGIEVADLLENHTIPQCKDIFIHRIKKEFGIDIPKNLVFFDYGEVCSE